MTPRNQGHPIGFTGHLPARVFQEWDDKARNGIPLSSTFPEPPMRDSSSPAPSQPDPLRAQLETWLNQQNQTLLEEVMSTWQQALHRFHPDEALLEGLKESLGGSAPLPSAQEAEAPLATALDLIEGATSQSDLLKRLLESLAPLVERSALFILKQGFASLYAQRGYEPEASPRSEAVVPPADLEALIQGKMPSLRQKGPAYTALLARLSTFEAAEAVVFPIHHRKKTVALLLADSGLRNHMDHQEIVRALVHAASAMLAALAAAKEEEARPQPAAPLIQSPPPPIPVSIPQASAPTQRIPDPIESAPTPGLDSRTRAAAERLARVLVGDIELYFPAKVAQARSTGNLYSLLRDELDRSRANFVERFGEELEQQAHIFSGILVQQLCDGEPGRLGTPPWN
jgi:hypothetical protein